MTAYLLQSGACLLSLLTIYNLLLARDKLLRFNRAWLLFSLLFSFAIPLLPFHLFATPKIPGIPSFAWTTPTKPAATGSIISNHPQPTYDRWILLLYVVVAAAFLLRFVRNLYLLLHRISTHPQVHFGHARLILLPQHYIPHTFGNAIFVHEKAYLDGAVDKEILAHELAHVRQFHTVDILLVEVLRILFWFNPLLILYKRAIQLNHEFLADEAVVNTYRNPRHYQQLLFDLISLANPSILSSPLNYHFTKKRLLMIHQIAPKYGWAKKLATLPLLFGVILFFSNSTHAQKTEGLTYPARMIIGSENLGANPYVLIDGKPYPADILTLISPKCIAATTIISDKKTAETKYGPIASDGAVSIDLGKQGLLYATAADKENLAIERSAKTGFYYRLRLKHDDGTPYDKIVVNWGGSASSEQKPGCKVAFIVNDKLYTEAQLIELQSEVKTMKIRVAGVGGLPHPIPGVDLSGYDVTFFFYSTDPSVTPASATNGR